MRVEGLPEARSHQAIDAAFEAIAAVHRLMSFHDPWSNLSRLNCEAAHDPVQVHPWTYRVLEEAQRFSYASTGCFDVTVAAKLVEWEFLPPPVDAEEPATGSWRDIELLPGNRVFFQRPLWIDLSGIAKGFAVDRAMERLGEFGAAHAVVNAGGDIRVLGSGAERIRLATESSAGAAPVLELINGSAAGSSGALRQSLHCGRLCGPHVDGSSRTPAPPGRFVCVVAEDCMAADALTKITMVKGDGSAELLRQFSASAYLHDPGGEWQLIGARESGAA